MRREGAKGRASRCPPWSHLVRFSIEPTADHIAAIRIWETLSLFPRCGHLWHPTLLPAMIPLLDHRVVARVEGGVSELLDILVNRLRKASEEFLPTFRISTEHDRLFCLHEKPIHAHFFPVSKTVNHDIEKCGGFSPLGL